MISPNSIITKNQDQLASEIDGKIILLGIDSGKYFAFDDISTDIWNRIDAHPLVADLCHALATDYNADLPTIQADVCILLSKLEENHLITANNQH